MNDVNINSYILHLKRFEFNSTQPMRKHKLKVIYLSGSCVVPYSAISTVVIAMGAFNIFIFKTTLDLPILWLSFLLAEYFPSLSFSLPALTQSQTMQF